VTETGERYSINAKGKFYVNEECIHCGLCEELAPTVFSSVLDEDSVPMYAYVKKQPETEEELEQAQDAYEANPYNCICVDGETLEETIPEKKLEELDDFRQDGNDSGRKIPIWVWIAVVMLPVLYFFSYGPAMYILVRFPSLQPILVVYGPIELLFEYRILDTDGWYIKYLIWWLKLAQ